MRQAPPAFNLKKRRGERRRRRTAGRSDNSSSRDRGQKPAPPPPNNTDGAAVKNSSFSSPSPGCVAAACGKMQLGSGGGRPVVPWSPPEDVPARRNQ